MRRRAALAVLAGGAVLVFGPAMLRRLRAPDLTTEPLPGLPGFRKRAGGNLSGGDPMLIGLDDAAPATPDEVCAHLFDGPLGADTVPIAYFSDARCVYCRVVSPMLQEIAETEPVRITWHELPLLGPASRRAAEASIAARRQGAYAMFHDRLMGTPFMPNDAYLRQLAGDAGIDWDRLLRDMGGGAVADTLTRSARIARAFGFFGTPALVVGRTAILGAVETWQLRRLIAAERAATDPHPCA
ncbi:DsbA family protein [Roseovarius sp. D22-M7]|uniref:DsbA family protein n=1 Tax=Roseovarius sp. D22-M7 TaxID=3127116 RepID=UPI00300F91E5